MKIDTDKCWVKRCGKPTVGTRGARGICQAHLDEAQKAGRDPFDPPAPKTEKRWTVSGDDQIEINRFERSFHRTVGVVAGEPCNWKQHFSGTPKNVIGYLDSCAALNPQRFWEAKVESICEACNRDYGEHLNLRHLKKILAYFRHLGIIARVAEMENPPPIGGRVHSGATGLIVAPHDSSCHVIDGICHFFCGGLKGLGWDVPGIKVRAVTFHGPACKCEECVAARNRKK